MTPVYAALVSKMLRRREPQTSLPQKTTQAPAARTTARVHPRLSAARVEYRSAVLGTGLDHSRRVMAETPESEATLVPHEGHVFVDTDPWSGHIVVSHVLTWERHILSDFVSASAIYDEEGDGVVVGQRPPSAEDLPAQEPEAVIMDDMFTCVYAGPGGEYAVLDSSSGRARSLNELRGAHILVDIALKRGPRNQLCAFEAAALKRPGECTMQLRWSLHDLYDSLALKCHQGRRWLWVSSSWAQWSRCLEGLFSRHERALEKAIPADADSKAEAKSGCSLRFPSVSTAGLIGLLTRFCGTTAPQCGRLQGMASVEVARNILALLCEVLPDMCVLWVMASTKAKLRWPRPLASDNPIEIPVVGRMARLCDVDWSRVSRPSDPCVMFLQFVATEGDGVIPIVELLTKVEQWRPRSATARPRLQGQIVMGLAEAVDSRLAAMTKRGDTHDFVQAPLWVCAYVLDWVLSFASSLPTPRYACEARCFASGGATTKQGNPTTRMPRPSKSRGSGG